MSRINERIVTSAQRPDLRDAMNALGAGVWPEFMLHCTVVGETWGELYARFPEFQFGLLDEDRNQVVAVGNCLPVRWDRDLIDLPDDGIEWALKHVRSELSGGHTDRFLCAIQIVVPKAIQGQGLSAHMIEAMRELGRQHGIPTLIAPVRPNAKHRYPLTSMERYISWTGDDGLPFDPWMRVHARLGGRVIGVCQRSMLIEGTLQEWETWTGMRFPDSGSYIVPGALTPVQIDREKDRGRYIEPNVWTVHGPGSDALPADLSSPQKKARPGDRACC